MIIQWTQRAENQLDDIFDFIKVENEMAAIRIYNQILDEVEVLTKFPNIAPVEPLLEDEPITYRSLLVNRRYKIVYFVNDELIYIVAVFDCHQNPNKLKKHIENF